MVKAIYCLLLYMFRSQFKLDVDGKDQTQSVLQVNLFVVRCYIQHWFLTQVPQTAPSSDLSFIRALIDYRAVNEAVANRALEKVARHLWYLSEELVSLAFFDKNVPLEVKRRMVEPLTVKSAGGLSKKRLQLSATLTIEKVAKRELNDFVTDQSLAFFTNLDLPQTFLKIDPSLLESDVDYQTAREAVLHLRVVNDLAERGVALIKAYTDAALTRDEKQLQALLLIVAKHRDQMPTVTKNAVLKTFDL